MSKNEPTPNPRERLAALSPAARISLLYFVVGALWILLSDTFLEVSLGQSLSALAVTQTLKGWAFVTVTAGGLYLLLKREFDARRRAEQMAIEREARFHTLFSDSPLPMWIYDRITLEFIDVNETACAQYGYTRQEFLMTHVETVHVPEDLPQLMHYLSQAHPGYHFSGEFHHLTRDKRVIEVNASANVLDFGGREAVLVAIQDITDHKRIEAERLETERLRLKIAKEAELQAMRGRFTSMVSHEFRRPLTTITTAIELLEHYRGRMSEETVQKHFLRLHRQLDEMRELLDDFLVLMRAETGPRELNLTEINLGTLCTSLIEELRPTAGDQHPLLYSANGSTEVILGDEKLLRQAISNLLTNAIKYSPDGGEVCLELTFGQGVEIHVRDHGIGIPAHELPRLFEPFYRASNVGELSGTGLGLSIAKQAAEAHGGSLDVARSDSSGTEFVLSLPASE